MTSLMTQMKPRQFLLYMCCRSFNMKQLNFLGFDARILCHKEPKKLSFLLQEDHHSLQHKLESCKQHNTECPLVVKKKNGDETQTSRHQIP